MYLYAIQISEKDILSNYFSTQYKQPIFNKKVKSLVKQNKLINNNNQTVLNLIGKFSSLAKVTHSIGLSFTLHLKLHQFFFN